MLNLFLITFFNILGFGITITLLPFFRDVYHLHEVAVGILISSYFIAKVTGSFVLGYLSDIFGRKVIFIISLTSLIISYLGIALIQNIPHSFTLFVILRIVAGFFAGNIAVAFASVANISNKDTMLKNMSLLIIALSSAFILGPIIGGILVKDTNIVLPLLSYIIFLFSLFSPCSLLF